MYSDLKPNRPLSPPRDDDVSGPDLENASGMRPANSSSTSATSRRRCRAFREVVGTVSGALEQEPKSYWFLLALSALVMVVSLAAASLLTRAYMESQDSRKVPLFYWLASAGWPIPALLLVPLYAFNRQAPPSQLFRSMPSKFFAWAVALGALFAASNVWVIFMSSALDDNGQLMFQSFHGCSLAITSLVFGRLVAKNRFRASVNVAAVVTIAALMAAHTNTKPFVLDEDYDAYNFLWYFLLDLPGSVTRGLAFAIIERVYFSKLRESTAPSAPGRGGRRVRAYVLVVLEVTLLVSFFSFAFSSIGLGFMKRGVGHYFQQETARSYSGGKSAYYAVVLGYVVAFQLAALAGAAIICLASATYAGVLGAVAVTGSGLVVAAFFDGDKLTGFSVLAFVLAMWGLVVHAYERCRARKSTQPI